MEPWNCLSDGKGTCFDNEKDPFRSRNSIFGTDQKTPNNLVNDGLMSEFVDIGLPDAMRKPFSNYPGNADGDSSVKVASSCLIASSWSSGMKECFPEPSNSLVGSNVEGEVSISDPDFGKDRSVITSINPSPQAKKSRLIGSCSQSLLCQVHGCNIDLSSSKDYHKRHRVCEAHSKTARVIVNGIEQRFCQQCSRFHLLAEFDDGKRSCRRRLAGHNERRRKPPFHFLSSKQQKLHHSYKGSKFFEMCSGGFSFEDRYEQSKNCRIIKFEDKSICSPQPSIPFLKGHSRQKPSFSHRALSLLSAQPQDFAHQVTATPYVRFNQAARVHQNMGWNFKNGLGVAARSDSNMVDLCRSEVFNVKTDMYVEDSTLRNPTATNHLGNPPTVNLIQLSSHLQRVEQQKTSVQVKHETADPCYFLGT